MATNSNPSSDVSIEELGPEDIEVPQDKKDETLNEDQKVADDNDQEEIEEIITDDSVLPREPEGDGQMIIIPSEKTIQEMNLSNLNNDDEDDEDDDPDDDDNFEDETILERIMALNEMFPPALTSGICSLVSGSARTARWSYNFARNAGWVVFTTAAIMGLPVVIETERLGLEEMQKQQQKQILFGPGAAVSGGPGAPNLAQNAPLPSQ